MPFTPAALRFFRGLAAHNEKPWFEAHRAEYEKEVRQTMRALIDDMNDRFATFAPEIGGDVTPATWGPGKTARLLRGTSPTYWNWPPT